MPEFILGARGHDFGRHDPETLFSSIGQAGFACTQLAFTKAVEGVKSYADVTLRWWSAQGRLRQLPAWALLWTAPMWS